MAGRGFHLLEGGKENCRDVDLLLSRLFGVASIGVSLSLSTTMGLCIDSRDSMKRAGRGSLRKSTAREAQIGLTWPCSRALENLR